MVADSRACLAALDSSMSVLHFDGPPLFLPFVPSQVSFMEREEVILHMAVH